jgi:hypothetical protein
MRLASAKTLSPAATKVTAYRGDEFEHSYLGQREGQGGAT